MIKLKTRKKVFLNEEDKIKHERRFKEQAEKTKEYNDTVSYHTVVGKRWKKTKVYAVRPHKTLSRRLSRYVI